MANSTADLSVMEIRKTSVKTKGLSIQGHPGLKIKFQDSQGYVMRHGLNTKTKQKTENKARQTKEQESWPDSNRGFEFPP